MKQNHSQANLAHEKLVSSFLLFYLDKSATKKFIQTNTQSNL